MLLKQVWYIKHLSRKPVPVLNQSLYKEMFPNVKFKPPLTQLLAVFVCPTTGYHKEEISISLLTSPPQED